MKNSKDYNIHFVGLKDGIHFFEYDIDAAFFQDFNFEEYNDVDVKVKVELDKKPSLLVFNFSVEGSVNVPCDVTGELFDQFVEGDLSLIVKFGQEFNDDSEEVLIIPQQAYEMSISQYIYELIVLSVPPKRIHPDVKNGTMQNDAFERFKELQHKEKKEVKDDLTDPRWDKLKNLLTGKQE